MELRNVVSISNMAHRSEVDLCVHCQSQQVIAELQGSLDRAGRDFCWLEELQKFSCVHLDDYFVLEFHFDGNN